MTCKELRFAIQPKLYEELNLEIPKGWSSVRFLEQLLAPQADGLRFTRAIYLSSQNSRVGRLKSFDQTDDGLYMESWNHGRTGRTGRRTKTTLANNDFSLRF